MVPVDTGGIVTVVVVGQGKVPGIVTVVGAVTVPSFVHLLVRDEVGQA